MWHPLASTGELDLSWKDKSFNRLFFCEACNSKNNYKISYLLKISLNWAFYFGCFHHHSYML
jgi:hypothetical protein